MLQITHHEISFGKRFLTLQVIKNFVGGFSFNMVYPLHLFPFVLAFMLFLFSDSTSLFFLVFPLFLNRSVWGMVCGFRIICSLLSIVLLTVPACCWTEIVSLFLTNYIPF